MILISVRRLAHIALQARHFPPSSGEADIKEERNYIFHYLNTLFAIILCRILTAPVGRVWSLIAFSRRSAPKNTIRLPSLLIARRSRMTAEVNFFLVWY